MRLKNPLKGKDQYSPWVLKKVTGLNTQTYAQWKQRGVIDAAVDADGAGTKSSYTFSDIARVELIRELNNYGIRMQKGKLIANEIISCVADWQRQDLGMSQWPIAYVRCRGKEIQVVFEDNEMAASALRLNLNIIFSNLCGRIEELPPERK